ncbi:hypothetical protein [Pseudoduganella sp. OTU4001]|uniref:hypothetical protein n=1 Tax=Pseudoduganella sp. OTU4001 TaxID=3043854 RepID=UPI00313A7BFE
MRGKLCRFRVNWRDLGQVQRQELAQCTALLLERQKMAEIATAKYCSIENFKIDQESLHSYNLVAASQAPPQH